MCNLVSSKCISPKGKREKEKVCECVGWWDGLCTILGVFSRPKTN